jgi:CRP-like cAMP-binding protein
MQDHAPNPQIPPQILSQTLSLPLSLPLTQADIAARLLSVLPNLEATTLDALGQTAQDIQIEAGQNIILQGETNRVLYFILHGKFGVYRQDHGGQDPFLVATLSAAEPFGEMALLDGEPRSASVRAQVTSRVLRLDPDEILALPDGAQHLAAFRAALAGFVTRRMRAANDRLVATLTRELTLKTEQQQFGRFFIYVLTMMLIGTLVNNAVARTMIDVDVYTSMFAWQYLAVLLVPSLLVVRALGISLRSLGLTERGLKHSLTEGAVLSVLLGAITFALGAALEQLNALPGTQSTLTPLIFLSYFLHCALQELLARGFLQSSFQRFLGDKSGWQSVVLTSILFGIFHLHFGMAAVGVTILSGCIFGAIYLRHKNLAGVTLVHFTAGLAAFHVGLI